MLKFSANNTFKQSEKLSQEIFKIASQNMYGRFEEQEKDNKKKKAKKIGHALIKTNSEDSIKRATQFSLAPVTIEEEKRSKEIDLEIKDNYRIEPEPAPDLRPLLNIQEINKYGKTVRRAHSPKGSRYYSRSSYDIELNNEKFKLALFSPEPRGYKFWGSDKNIKMFKDGKIPEHEKIIKCVTQTIISKDIIPRSMTPRKPDQNTVMKKKYNDSNYSACYAAEDFALKHFSSLTKKGKDKLEHGYTANLSGPDKKDRFELLHAVSYAHWPIDQNPQVSENLGIAAQWVNSAMMPLEQTITFLALCFPEVKITSTTTFEMLLESDLIAHVYQSISIEKEDKKMILNNHIAALGYPIYIQPGDIAQVILAIYSLFNDVTPDSIQNIFDFTADSDSEDEQPTKKRKFK